MACAPTLGFTCITLQMSVQLAILIPGELALFSQVLCGCRDLVAYALIWVLIIFVPLRIAFIDQASALTPPQLGGQGAPATDLVVLCRQGKLCCETSSHACSFFFCNPARSRHCCGS